MASPVYADIPHLNDRLYKHLKFSSTAHNPVLDRQYLEFEAETYPKYLEKSSQVSRDAYIGIEIEVENVQKWNPPVGWSYWHMKDDSSLRNNGKEFTTIPIRGKRISMALDQFFNGVNRTIDFSHRTSIHVHLNVQDFSFANIASLALIYAVLERLLFKWIGLDREKSIYCVPLYETMDMAKLWNVIKAKMSRPVSYKYAALNFNPICMGTDLANEMYGTVEFRQLGGTADIERILVWIDTIQELRKAALNASVESYHNEICSLNTTRDYVKFVKKVLPQTWFNYIAPNIDLGETVAQAVMEVKRTTFLNAYHLRLISSIPSAQSPYVKTLRKQYGAFSIVSTPKKSLSNDALEEFDPILGELGMPLLTSVPNFDEFTENEGEND